MATLQSEMKFERENGDQFGTAWYSFFCNQRMLLSKVYVGVNNNTD